MSIVIYARVSPTKRKKGDELALSIEKQLDKCRKQAEVDNETIFKEYYDEYISGKAIEYMKSFQQMLHDAKSGLFKENQVNKIYVLRVDRFGRNFAQMVKAYYDLRNCGVDIKFVEQGFDTSDKFGRMIMGIMASVAEWQRETIIENTKIGWDIAYKNHPERFGRPKKEIDWKKVEMFLNVKKEDGSFAYSWNDIARALNIAVSTLLRRYRKEVGKVPLRKI